MTFYFFVLILVAKFYTPSSFASLEDQMIELARVQQGSQNVGMIRAHVPYAETFSIFSGSCVYLGNQVAVTNAHCLTPWTWCGKLRCALTTRFEIADQTTQVINVLDVIVHPKASTEHHSDIALLRLDPSVKGILNPISVNWGLPIAYPLQGTSYEDLEKYWTEEKSYRKRQIVSVGYGTSGSIDGGGCNDGKKRAVRTEIWRLNYVGGTDLLIQPWIETILGMQEDETAPGIFHSRPLLPAEGGFRYGMSGGGIFLEDRLIGINARLRSPVDATWKDTFKEMWGGYVGGEYLGAVGIPVPFINPRVGAIDSQINLSFHREWIESVMVDWDISSL